MFFSGPIREKVIEFLVSKAGGVLIPAINMGIAWLVGQAILWLDNSIPQVAALTTPQQIASFEQWLDVMVWGLLMCVVNYATNHWLTKDAAAIQAALNKKGYELGESGYINDKTVQALVEHTGLQVLRAVPATPSVAPLIAFIAILTLSGCASQVDSETTYGSYDPTTDTYTVGETLHFRDTNSKVIFPLPTK